MEAHYLFLNDCFFLSSASNLANMRQMMHCEPDLSIPLEPLIITDHETNPVRETPFKCLELSATRSCMLLEWEIVQDYENNFM